MTWLLDGEPTEWMGGEYKWAFALSYEIGDRAYEALRLEHDAYLAHRWGTA